MKRKFMYVLLALAALALAAAGPAAAQEAMGPPHGAHFGPPCGAAFWHDSRMVKELGLSDDQIKELEALDDSFRPEAVTMHVAMDKAHRSLDKSINDATVGDDAVLAQARSLAEMQRRMLISDVEQRLKVRKTLTADQLKKLATLEPSAPPPPPPPE